MSRPATVLFDVGNVLFPDPWETLLLTPGKGLADRYGLDAGALARTARALWHRFSTVESTADAYWDALARETGVPLTARAVEALEGELLHPHPRAAEFLARAAEGGRAVGVVSNNTSFWYATQSKALDLDRYVEPDLVFLSFRYGVEKGSPGRGLFEIAAEHTAATALVVEDRPPNVLRARRAGFRTVHYAMDQEDDAQLDELLSGLSGSSA